MSNHTIPQTGMTESILLQLPLRILLGGMFLFAAYNKIPAIESFAEAIKGFKVIDADSYQFLIIIGAFVIPWFELVAGLLLVLGLRARSAALGIGLLLAVFIYALMHVILTDVSADCSCFGDTNLICDAAVGYCQVVRNGILLIPAAYLLWRGPGRLSIDQLIGKPEQIPPNPENASQSVRA